MSKVWQYLRDFWDSLPHTVQGGLVAFGSGFVAAAAQELSEPTACFSPSCLRHYVPTFIAAGVVSLRAFYLMPNRPTQKDEHLPPTPPPAHA